MFGGFGASNTSTFGGTAFPNATGQTGSVFGQPQQQPAASSSLFGGGFNQAKPTFGSGFGAPQQTTNTMFGQQQNRLPVPSTGGMFSGQTATVSPFSGGGQAQISGTSVPFNAITGADTMMKNGTPAQINTRHQCITCMKEYENKSLEELRMEDYQLNRKGPTQGGLFGATQQQSTGLFSSIGGVSAAPSPFGQTTSFGAGTNTAGGGLFSNLNQPKPATGFFNSNPATSTTGFGSNPAFSFNSNTANQPASVFGANNNPVSSGGTLGAQNTFSFGQQNQPGAGLFAQKPLNTPTTSAFGSFGGSTFTNATPQNKTLGFGGFGTNTSTSAFGTTSTPAFGTGTNTLFGSQPAQQNKPAFSFSAPFSSQPQATQSTFGTTGGTSFAFPATTSTAPTINFGTGSNSFGGGLNTGSTAFGTAPLSFGGTQNSGFGSFGLNTSSTPGFASFTPSTNFGQQQLQQQQSALMGPIAFATTPYKDSPLFYNLIANRNLDEMVKPTSPSAQRAIKEASRRRTSTSLSFSAATPNKSISFSGNKSSSFNKSIFDGFDDDEKGITIDILSPKTSVKKLNLKNFRNSSAPSQRHSISFAPSTRLINSCMDNGLNDSASSEFNTSRNNDMGGSGGDAPNSNKTMDQIILTSFDRDGAFIPQNSAQKRFSDADRSLINGVREKSGCRVTSTRAGYYIIPSLENLDALTDEAGNCIVKGLVIGRQNHGEIRFLDSVNIRGVNVDEIVHFRHKEVVVYPDDNNKPPLGEGLNCPAYVTLERVWPIDKVTKDPIKLPQKLQTMGYEDMLRRACTRLSSEFISYTAETGVWVFKVPHFSKYNCDVEESEGGTDAETSADGPKGLGGILMPQHMNVTLQKQQQSPYSSSQESTGQSQDNLKKWSRPSTADSDDIETITLFRGKPLHATTSMMLACPMDDSNMYECGDVEHNPLTPSESNDSDIDWLNHNNGRGDESYHSVLKGRTESTAVQMMKSILLSDPEDDYEDFQQPPNKKSRAPILRGKDVSTINIEIKPSETSQRKSLISLKHSKPALTSSINLEESDNGQLMKNYLTSACKFSSIQKKNETELRSHTENLFENLTLGETHMVGIRTVPRVCFGPMGIFLHGMNLPTVGKGPIVSIKKLNSYTEQMDPSSNFSMEILEKQMYLQLHGTGPLVSEHIKLLSSMVRQSNDIESLPLQSLKNEAMMWELCQTIWPVREEDLAVQKDIGFVIRQRKQLSIWLKTYCRELFCDTIGDADSTTVLGLLKMGRRKDACLLAVKQRNYILAMCLAQKPMAKSTGSNCEEQLRLWTEEGALKFVEEEVQLSYRLCCGKPITNNIDLSKMSTSEWLQHFALYVWYSCPPHMSVEKMVVSFQTLLKAEFSRQTMKKPNQQTNVHFPAKEDSSIPNLCIQLLKLYGFCGYPLRSLLNPRTSNPDCLQYKLSWLLMINLEKFGYVPESELHDSITTAFAGQLEQTGLFHWATFVTHHLPSLSARKTNVQRILERNLGMFGTIDSENFLEDKLGVSRRTIFAAKAMHAAVDRRKDRLVWYLLKAGEYQNAFNELLGAISIDTVTSSCAMPCMLSDLEELKHHANDIRGWYSKGSFLLEYMRLFVSNLSSPLHGFLEQQHQSAGFESLVTSFVNSFVQYQPKQGDECALLLELVLSAQKIVAVLMENNSDYLNDFGTEDRITSLVELPIPKEYMEELEYFLTRWLTIGQ